jgi:predicted metal-dependent hydrolase
MSPAERSVVAWGNTKIPYAIARSPRRATVSLAVDGALGLLVTAPMATPTAKLDAVVKAKAQWVVARLRDARENVASEATREFVSGESFRYLGRQYRLRLTKAANVAEAASVRMLGGWLTLPVPRDLTGEGSRLHARAALVRWYRARAELRLPNLTETWAKRLGVKLTGVVVTEQHKRWGSCTAEGIVRLNWRIVQAPLKLIEYVVAHEAAHLAHADHGPEFWRALERVMPDYEARRRALRAMGAELVW